MKGLGAGPHLRVHGKGRKERIGLLGRPAIAALEAAGITEGFVLVSAMHITSGVYVNDWEDGLIQDFQVWLEKLAPAGLPAESVRALLDVLGKAADEQPWLLVLTRRPPGEVETLAPERADRLRDPAGLAGRAAAADRPGLDAGWG